MIFFIFIIIAIILFVGLNLKYEVTDRERIRFKLSARSLLAVISLTIGVFTSCITFIQPNNVGIIYSAIYGTSEKTLSEGIAFKSPLDKVYQIPTTVQERTVDNVSVQTKDAQWVTMSVNIKYQVNAADAFKVFKNYKTLENLQENLIANIAQRSIEEVTTNYNVIDVLGEQRNQIYAEIEQKLKERLADEAVQLKLITIKDTDAGEAIEKAIQDEAVAKKAVETAKQLQEKAEIEAETKLIEAQGEADANAVKTKQLTEKILAEMWINKWNGELPTVTGSNDVMLDISNLTNTNSKE